MKNHTFLKTLLVLTGICVAVQSYADNSNVSKVDAKLSQDTVKQIGRLMTDNYVFPDIGKQAAKALNLDLQQGSFSQYEDSKDFARALTKALRKATLDKHLGVVVRQAGGKHHSQQDMLNQKHKDRERQREWNQGIAQVSRLAGNIGYLDLRGFMSLEQGKSAIDASMSLLTSADAMIIDLRKNGGGDPLMVQYLSSFFFGKRLLLNSLYYRAGEVTEEYWTLDKVNGPKLADIPLYILTSNYTFSAAEEFSYNMQTQKRATLVGETTGGGANPGDMFNINEHFAMFVPTGRAINPITQTNWDGTGVVPEVKVEANLALEKAVELATISAQKVRLRAREL